MNGYTGHLLIADLTSGTLDDEPLNVEWARQFVGGSGLAARYLYDRIGPHTDPLGPDNPLLIMTGPLTGTRAPASGRWTMCARSPLTGLWGEANCGGFFGAELRFAGYDGVLITGQADAPTYLLIRDGQAELRDAGHLWGQTTYATETLVREEIGDRRLRVMSIGPAGENRVPLAAVLDGNGRALGRSGLGAVMGSKRLKALAARGHRRVPLADPEGFAVAAREATEIVRTDFSTALLREGGTAFWVDMGLDFGDTPVRYFSRDGWNEGAALSGATMAETILTKHSACYGCPIACGRVVKVTEGPYRLPEGDGPEYETIAAFGTSLLVDDLPAVAAISRRCNALGLDTISAGVTIAFAHHLFERGVLSEADTGGLALRWGDPGTVLRLLDVMARREGFGAVLAEGTRAMGARYGCPQEAAHVKGLEIPMHDPRAFSGSALAYATGPRGACHNKGDMHGVDVGAAVEELDIIPGDRFGVDGKAEVVARNQDWRGLYDALVMCIFSNPPVDDVLATINAATGWGLAVADLKVLGERIFQLKRAINCRLGLTPADDRLPDIVLRPLEGGTEGHVPDVERLLADYYAVRDWDTASGKPNRARLESLGLGWTADDLWDQASS